MKLFKSMIIATLLLFSCSAVFAMGGRDMASAGGLFAYASNTETDTHFSGPGFYVHALSQLNGDRPLMIFADGSFVFPTSISEDGVEHRRGYYDFLFSWDMLLGGGLTKAVGTAWLNAGCGFYLSQQFSYTDYADTRDTLLGVGALVSLHLVPAEPIIVELGVRGGLGIVDFQKVRYHRSYMEDEDNTGAGLSLNIGARLGIGVQF